MKKRILSLALALALCLGLAVPAMAAGTTEIIEDEEYGIKITLNGFLRKETNRYLGSTEMGDGPVALTIYVVEDNSTVAVEALPGQKYCTEDDWDGCMRNTGYWSFSEEWGFRFSPVDGVFPLFKAITRTVAPTKADENGEYGGIVSYAGSVLVACESDLAKLPLFEGKPNAADWAQEALDKAFDAGLFPTDPRIDPFEDDCTRGMTRKEFAAVTVNLYEAMGGSLNGVSVEEPFTDVSWNYAVGRAYNLGFVTGTSETTFSPDTTLTREQAAVMLSRVYAKLHGDIPAVTTTSFADDASVGSWAKSGVAFMADKGIVNGVGGNNFAPQQTLSIQEAMVMAQRMLENLK